MAITDYHSKYFAYELTRRCPPGSTDRLAGAVVSAQVDLNPHQVDAALFAFRSPLSKGVLLADEVGLGKTIEAGLVLSQKWAENRRRILVITPANLRKQWYQELTEKFFLPCRILESRSYKEAVQKGRTQPFEGLDVVICSYQFAKANADDVKAMAWDVVVIDEAHRLRNVYKTSNVTANALKSALAGKYKLLLTATPLQNSVLELYGLVSFLDEHTFGDLKSFREQFGNVSRQSEFDALRARLEPNCHRTLRRQVSAIVPYTRRHPMLEEFTPEANEDQLYNLVSEYLRRDNLQALPPSQRSLMTLVLRKLLASSTFAIAGALETISKRLRAELQLRTPADSLAEELDHDYEALDELADEWSADPSDADLAARDRQALAREIADLESFAKLATSIEHNAKGKSLLKALDLAFQKARELGADEKAILFTESRRTQSYLLRVLTDSPFGQGIVLFNGDNTDEGSKGIYRRWLERHEGSDRVTGSRTADMRSALVDYFREEGRIMIATEAGAEGINLQFCSLVVNYDLPWNPQRIEQRIGRCHRYGQKHDVVVVNFLNKHNAADQRVYQLLSEKFHLFEGIFGASDEVLGAIESGVDFEKRIAGIYQGCRHPDEIRTAFDQLQLELSPEINQSMARTRQKLLENFDDEVREKLRAQDESSRASLTRYERLLMQLTRHELDGHAEFGEDTSFRLLRLPTPAPGIPLGLYELPRRTGEAHLYRLNHPLSDVLIERAKARHLPQAQLAFDYERHEGKVALLEPLRGQAGWLSLTLLIVEALDQAEDHLIFAAVTDAGEILPDHLPSRLLSLPAELLGPAAPAVPGSLAEQTQRQEAEIQAAITDRNTDFFAKEADKLDSWADDLKLALEREIKELDRQIKEARRAAAVAPTLEEKLAVQREIRILESHRNQKRRSLFEAQDVVDRRRDQLIADIEAKLKQSTLRRELLCIRWTLR